MAATRICTICHQEFVLEWKCGNQKFCSLRCRIISALGTLPIIPTRIPTSKSATPTLCKTITIPLHGSSLVAIVDEADYGTVEPIRWYRSKGTRTNYAVGGKGSLIVMHRLIMGITDPKIEVDHKDGNGLNNSRSNLRIATKTQQQHNSPKQRKEGITSVYKGVSKNTSLDKWVAQIRAGKKTIYLGAFETEEEAAKVYDEAARICHGEFACLNFPCKD